MSAQITYPDTYPRYADTRLIALQKILQRENALSGVTGGGSGSVTSGAGAPSVDPGVDSALYYDTTTMILYHWDDANGVWV